MPPSPEQFIQRIHMSTQYNQIQKPYDELRKTTIGIVERVDVREIVLPLVQNAHVLDLACGSGFYTRTFLSWGAESVVGVDISSAMLAEARALNPIASKVSFIEADCSKPTAYTRGPFDIVFGGWLLNYAPTEESMVDFYRNISINLKPGGVYVGVTPPPTDDPAGHYERECQLRPLPIASSGLYSTTTGRVKDGVTIHRHMDTRVGNLDFDCYHLNKSVWERAAKQAGFAEPIKWSVTKIPHDFMEYPAKYGEVSSGSAAPKEVSSYDQVPHYGLMVLQK